MRLTNVLRLAVLTGFLCAPVASAQGASGEKLGTVIFPVSCSPAASEQFARAVAMLHSFWYEEAVKAFTEVTVTDPSCAMGFWGVAMSMYYPLWYPPSRAGTMNSTVLEKLLMQHSLSGSSTICRTLRCRRQSASLCVF